MKLFEARNGQNCFSYVRCYIWAPDEGAAELMAVKQFQQSGIDRSDNIKIKALFDENAGPFVTAVNDEGWETVEEKKSISIPRHR